MHIQHKSNINTLSYQQPQPWSNSPPLGHELSLGPYIAPKQGCGVFSLNLFLLVRDGGHVQVTSQKQP
ncbi:hypothetical protein BGX38DRAFT_202309 [Terfezia claveryi]|nr:hypothetical protein BGX38DRAFT_202309 [Terfezia claveryi]